MILRIFDSRRRSLMLERRRSSERRKIDFCHPFHSACSLHSSPNYMIFHHLCQQKNPKGVGWWCGVGRCGNTRQGKLWKCSNRFGFSRVESRLVEPAACEFQREKLGKTKIRVWKNRSAFFFLLFFCRLACCLLHFSSECQAVMCAREKWWWRDGVANYTAANETEWKD